MKYRSSNDGREKEISDQAAEAAPYDPISLTIQAHAEDADINVLMTRYGLTGKFPENPRVPTYGDFSEIGDFRTALAAISNAQAAFNEYPATFRARFENDPQKFLEWTTNEANRAEMQQLGMLRQPPQETPNVRPPDTASTGAIPNSPAPKP